MRLLLSLLLGFTGSLLGQIRFIDAGIFRVEYNEHYEQPQRLWYTVSCTESLYSRSGLNFYGVDSVHTSNDADYANNVYDKGHLAPAADFACNETALRQTFSYLNCALQHESLNRGPWKALEDHERQLAQVAQVEVRVELEFSNSQPLPTGAVVPSHFTKILTQGDREWRYRFPNDASVKGRPYSSFLVGSD